MQRMTTKWLAILFLGLVLFSCSDDDADNFSVDASIEKMVRITSSNNGSVIGAVELDVDKDMYDARGIVIDKYIYAFNYKKGIFNYNVSQSGSEIEYINFALIREGKEPVLYSSSDIPLGESVSVDSDAFFWAISDQLQQKRKVRIEFMGYTVGSGKATIEIQPQLTVKARTKK